ncbi:hypothetical protein [Georgenia sp. MJ170]|uniref:hypothetical protein n=1 Tax=Georgenia sunbinii TaxID=3117728 RepID=UPI002F2650DD
MLGRVGVLSGRLGPTGRGGRTARQVRWYATKGRASMRVDSAHRSVWRARGTGWRTFTYIWLPLTVLFLGWTFFADDVHWGTRVVGVSNVLVASLTVLEMRKMSAADSSGIEVTELKTRRIPWSAVERLRPVKPGMWSIFIPVKARLVDGSALTLPHVPASDLVRLERLRTKGAEPPGGSDH